MAAFAVFDKSPLMLGSLSTLHNQASLTLETSMFRALAITELSRLSPHEHGPKRRRFSSIVSVALLILSNFQYAVAANSFVYTPPADSHPGKFSGELPLDKIGEITLPRGLASFSDDELTIKAVPQWLFDRNVVLKGAIVRAEAVPQQGQYVLGGLVFMLDGMWLPNLGNANAVETIDTIDGASLRGRIIGRTVDSFSFKREHGSTEELAFSKVKSIESKRAFRFNITADGVKLNPSDNSVAFDAKQIVLKPSQTSHPLLAFTHPALNKSNLKGTEEGISKGAMATFVALDIISTIAPAIAIPLVINAKNQAAAKRTIARTEYQNFVQSIQPSPSPSSGTQTASSSSSSGP